MEDIPMWIRRAGLVVRAGCAWLFVAAAAIVAEPSSARAGFTQFFQLHATDYSQNSNSPPAAESSASYLARPTSTTSPDFTSVTLTPPVGSSFGLTESPAGSGFWDSGLFSHQFATNAQLDAAFPTGTYTLTGAGGSSPASATITYAQSAYPVTVPFLTGTTYSSLQGLDSSQPITLTWDAFVPSSLATSSSLFLTINGTSGTVFNQFLPTSATSVTLAANTFSPGAHYTFQLGWFSDVTSTNTAGTFLDNRFAYATTGAFTAAAVPEPSTLVLELNAGLMISLGVWRTTRRRRASVYASMIV
jgi:hypothetical protein